MICGNVIALLFACSLASAQNNDTSSVLKPTSTGPSATAYESAKDEEGSPIVLEPFTVTGSLFQQKTEKMATPVVTIGQSQIANLGLPSLGSLTNYVPQNVNSQGGLQDLAKGGVDSRDTRSMNLRNLGAGATLSLLNGRRFIAGDGYANLNAMVPAIAIDRVETVLDGASATYGADAVAGVVNIITNSHYTGFDATTQFTTLADAIGFSTQFRMGTGSERFHIVTSMALTHQTHLQNRDRAVTNIVNLSAGAGSQPGQYTMYARPKTSSGGDVIIDGHNYSTLYDQFKNSAGALTVVDPMCGSSPAYGTYLPAANSPGWGLGLCGFNFQPLNPIRPTSTSVLLHNDVVFEITRDTALYLESSFFSNVNKRYGVPSVTPLNGPSLPVVPAANPYNPFGVDVYHQGRIIGNEGFGPDGKYYEMSEISDNVLTIHTVLGLRGQIAKDWRYDVAAESSYYEDRYTNTQDTDMILLQAGYNGFGGVGCSYRWNGPGAGSVAGKGACLWVSPFAKDMRTQNVGALFNMVTPTTTVSTFEYLIADGVVSGTVADLPGGRLGLAFGTHFRKESSKSFPLILEGAVIPTNATRYNRDVKSAFAEAELPVFKNLKINIAGRQDDYGSYKKTVPKAGVGWQVIPDKLTLRGSWGKAFQAPNINNATDAFLGTAGAANLTDPVKNSTTFTYSYTYGNPQLKPQTNNNYNFGVTYNPTRRMMLSLDYWNYKYEDRIGLQSAQAILATDPNGPQVIRDQNGFVQYVVVKSFNASGGTRTSGIDAAVAYSLNALGGTISLRDNITMLLKYDIDTGSLVYDGVGRRNASTTSPASANSAPKYRNVLSLDWKKGPHFLSVSHRYSSSVGDDYAQAVAAVPSATVRAWSVFDWQYRYTFGRNKRYDVAVGMLNALDTEPGVAKYTGYLAGVADVLGRQTYVKAGVHF